MGTEWDVDSVLEQQHREERLATLDRAGTLGRVVVGAKDLLLDAWDALLGVEYEDRDALPTSTGSNDGDSSSDDAGSPTYGRPSSAPASQTLMGGLVAALPRSGLRALKSLQNLVTPKEDGLGGLDMLPRTSQQARQMADARERRTEVFLDLDPIHGY